MTEHRIIRRPAGENIHVTVDGHGPAILFLAGTGHDSSDWHRAGYVARLSGSYQVIAVDLPGQGGAVGAADLLASLRDAPGNTPRGRLRAHVEPGLDHESVFEQSERTLISIGPFLAENIW